MRKKIFEIIEIAENDNKISMAYDWFMIGCILVSIIPLAFVKTNKIFSVIDIVTVCIFIVDYLLRLLTADLKLEKGWKSFVQYPFTFMAIVDLVSILPSLSIIGSGWKLLKLFRMLRTIKVFRVFKAFRYSKSIQVFLAVFKKQKDALITIIGVAVAYVLISALIVLNVEPETFGNYFRAVYWATVSLTTVGYGDIYPVSTAGQIVTMISSFVGIAIVAMPAGIITAGFIEEVGKKETGETNEK